MLGSRHAFKLQTRPIGVVLASLGSFRALGPKFASQSVTGFANKWSAEGPMTKKWHNLKGTAGSSGCSNMAIN